MISTLIIYILKIQTSKCIIIIGKYAVLTDTRCTTQMYCRLLSLISLDGCNVQLYTLVYYT